MAFSGSTHRQKEAPRCGNLHILHIGTTSSKFTVSIQHIRNMSAIWDQLWLTDPLGSNWVQYAATWPQVGSNFGPSWAPHGAKYELLKHAFSRVFTRFLGASMMLRSQSAATSPLSYSLGVGGARREATRILYREVFRYIDIQISIYQDINIWISQYFNRYLNK